MLAKDLITLHNIVTDSNKKKTKNIQWTKEAENSFNTVRGKFSQNTLLIHFDRQAKISLAVYALNVVVGTVLQQLIGICWKHLAYFSRKLSYTENDILLLIRN